VLTRRRLWKAEFPGVIKSVRSTLLDLKCKDTTQIFERELGKMPLATLAEWLQADDMEEPGTYLAALLNAKDCAERDLGPWEDPDGPGLAKQVHGKLRLVKMRIPVPPAPMCPPTTRIEQAVHFFAEEDRVIRETSTLSLDVPCGTYFNVVIRDTYTLTDSGAIKMVRTFGLEWLMSTYLKSMIEANVPKNLVADAELQAELLTKWVSSGGPPGEEGERATSALDTKKQPAQESKKSMFSACNMLCCSDSSCKTSEVVMQ